jgi:hypothetical protein
MTEISAPIITMTPGSFVYNVYAQFPGVSGNETSNVRITLTKMDYFAYQVMKIVPSYRRLTNRKVR